MAPWRLLPIPMQRMRPSRFWRRADMWWMRRLPLTWSWALLSRKALVLVAVALCWFLSGLRKQQLSTTVAKPLLPKHRRTCSCKTRSPCLTYRRGKAASPWVCPAWLPCIERPMNSMGACLGLVCFSLRFVLPRRGLRCRPDWLTCFCGWRSSHDWMKTPALRTIFTPTVRR